MNSFQSLSCPKTSTIKEQKNHSPKEDGETYSLSKIRKYEKWLMELGELGGKPKLCTNDGVLHVNQISPQYRFIESEKRILESTVNIAYTSSRDYTDQNASINSTFDTHFTHQQQGKFAWYFAFVFYHKCSPS
ncbi:unnamed protein product [Larinioides sclopetarius]|uniref:Uncharacterized protein n=1 Tax=Larinioides sclopetarius TaxID=280406 RepID=A0AAV2BLG5_9ARAC